MRIGLDIQTTLGEKTGFGFYVENLAKALKRQIREGDQLLTYAPDRQRDLNTLERWWWDQITLTRQAKSDQLDIFHQPAFSAPVFYHGRTVVTIHDVISLFHRDIPLVSRQYYAKWMPFSYRFADHIITISEHSKKDIQRYLPMIPEEKISVIYSAADPSYAEPVSQANLAAVRNKFSLKGPFILNVGTINPRKNLEFLVNVFAESKKRFNLDDQLIIAGKKGWQYQSLFSLIKRLGLEDRVRFLGYVTDQEKAALYHLARIFVFPSLYEGFGLPPLEAMISGCPVISSSTSSLPEVVGDGGILLPPDDRSAWVEAIGRLINDHHLREKTIILGRKQAESFSWERCAKETLRVYSDLRADTLRR